MSYMLPRGHVKADAGVVEVLLRTFAPHGWSLSDFGAGVGQYGRALLAREPSFSWRGYDGAGDVEQLSEGFVGFFDLADPTLSLPRADWVMSLEVAEHVPAAHEFAVVRNLHAHNRRGIVLSWGALHQPGVAHVNNHNATYIAKIFDGLGYWCAPRPQWSHALEERATTPQPPRLAEHSALLLCRWQVLCPCYAGCERTELALAR
jgi:hypothetical protein